MVPLETNHLVLTWLCVFPPDESTSRLKRMAYTTFSLAIFGINAGSFFGSLAYFLKFMSVDLEQSLFAVVQMLGEVNMAYISIITYLLRHRITATYESLAKIYKAREYAVKFFLISLGNRLLGWNGRFSRLFRREAKKISKINQ